MASGLDMLASLDWPERDSKPKYKVMPWRKIFRYLGEDKGFSKRDLQEMTFYEMSIHICDEKDLGGIVRMEADEAKDFLKDREIITITNDPKTLERFVKLKKESEQKKVKDNGGRKQGR